MNAEVARKIEAIKGQLMMTTLMYYINDDNPAEAKLIDMYFQPKGVPLFKVSNHEEHGEDAPVVADLSEAVEIFLSLPPQVDAGFYEMLDEMAALTDEGEAIMLVRDREQQPSEASTGDEFEVLDFAVKRSVNESGFHEYSYKLAVENMTTSDITLAGKVIFVDEDEFEVTSGHVAPFVVRAGAKHQEGGMEMIYDQSHINRIVDVKLSLEEY